MDKKKLLMFVGIGIIFMLSSALTYWFYFSKPVSFPNKEQLVEEINKIFPEAAATVIQDTIPVDERHVLVPFISNESHYGLSYWVWKKHKWRVAFIDASGEPRLWKVDRNNPSSYHFVWNIHPEDHLSAIDFYMLKDRGYLVTEGKEFYYPKVQMEESVSLREKPYGALQLPEEWVSFMNTFIKVESAKQPNLFFNDIFTEQYVHFGWISYDQTNKESFPERSFSGGGSYSNDNVNLDFLMILEKEQLEVPELD
ncbi:hypothetical protein ACFFF5_08770 [Lederbergia wuyishanensis]|uniref:Uncharacterized protein n=1 Tax=Lederbergia wuyishanensis TaxID=1347903 RepID=A0ABU0D6A8_9BACI|nr:hypothetical protein [Lederbergia wuyishanensis]MCJ8008695.1 hypothetical protein [Lederbergia wuyishanensis]MDQ0343886.1 hypothetical protein [Lederbergia wuyishanensis]